MKYLILLSGKINTGKNQFAEFLKKALEDEGVKVKQDLYARDLKDYSVEDFKMLGQVLDQQVEKIKANIGMFFQMANVSMDVQDNIYRMLEELTFKKENFYEDKTIVTRALLQLYGTDIARKRFDDQFWVKRMADRINEDIHHDVIIVTDVRFPNEVEDIYDFVKDVRVVPIRIERQMDRSALENEHASETALDDFKFWEYIVENNGTLNDLLDYSKTVAKDILSPDE